MLWKCMGNTLKEDPDNHHSITTVKMEMLGNILTQAIIMCDGASAEIAVYAHKGLIKQQLAEETIDKLKGVHC